MFSSFLAWERSPDSPIGTSEPRVAFRFESSGSVASGRIFVHFPTVLPQVTHSISNISHRAPSSVLEFSDDLSSRFWKQDLNFPVIPRSENCVCVFKKSMRCIFDPRTQRSQLYCCEEKSNSLFGKNSHERKVEEFQVAPLWKWKVWKWQVATLKFPDLNVQYPDYTASSGSCCVCVLCGTRETKLLARISILFRRQKYVIFVLTKKILVMIFLDRGKILSQIDTQFCGGIFSFHEK